MQPQSRLSPLLVSAVFLVSACSSTPNDLPKPSGENRVAINSASSVADLMASYYRSQKEAKAKLQIPKVTEKMSVAKALEQYVPADFKVFSAEGVDLQTVIDYEVGKPWPEALGEVLTEIDVDMTANLDQRTMTLKRARLTVAEVVQKYVPGDFSVYADDAVDMNSRVTFDRSSGWAEALGRAMRQAGVSSTINLRNKLVVLKPVTAAPAAVEVASPRELGARSVE